jgi:hypothetical protein
LDLVNKAKEEHLIDEITATEEWEEKVMKSELPILIDFYAE